MDEVDLLIRHAAQLVTCANPRGPKRGDEWHQQSRFAALKVALACDIFLEDHAFDPAQAQRILEAARARGLPVKAHVDQFNSLGGVPLAIQMGAVSVDHLEVTMADDVVNLGRSDTVAVLQPFQQTDTSSWLCPLTAVLVHVGMDGGLLYPA